MTFEQFYDGFEDRQQWLEEALTAMRLKKFDNFGTFVFTQTNIADDTQDGHEFFRIKGCC